MKKKRVICAMSGGVDSSVAAALLQKNGYEVIGIFMKLWAEDDSTNGQVRENVCCSLEAATAARMVADKLKIPFYVVNFAEEFKKTVVDYYINEYDQGRTPNPCVICNRDIKGEVLLNKATELGADYLATGHYAQVKKVNENFGLFEAIDMTKDQTYFLWTLTLPKINKVLFPIGHLTKPEVRELAKDFNLPTAQRRESQGICFIPDRNVGGFLQRYAKNLTKPGNIINLEGEILGKHEGLINYTVGQRQRLGLGGPKAYYVIKLDSENNNLVVGEDSDLYTNKLIASSLNWITDKLPEKEVGGRIRYGHPIDRCKIKKLSQDRIEVLFEKPQRAITPGQSIVFYSLNEGNEPRQVLGGGIIEGTE